MEARLRTLFASGTGARQFSLALDPAVAKELESLCEDLNIPRESLLNRLFMLLGASGHFLADRFTDLTPEPKSDSGFRADESQDDMTPFETPPKHLITTNWLRGGTFDVVALALDLTRADPATADYDKALAPLGRVESVVDDPLRWYRWMLQMTFHQRAMLCREAGKPEQATAMEQDRWTYTPFGMTFLGEELMDGFNCHMPDSWPEQESPSQLAVKPAQSAATAATAPVKQPK